MPAKLLSAAIVATACFCASILPAQNINLPSSKELTGDEPGHPQRLNSLPISMTISPDGRYVVTVNAGYGTYESQYQQSLAVLDTQAGKQVLWMVSRQRIPNLSFGATRFAPRPSTRR